MPCLLTAHLKRRQFPFLVRPFQQTWTVNMATEAISAWDERGQRTWSHNSEEGVFSQVLFKVTLQPEKWDLMFFIYLLWNLAVFSPLRGPGPKKSALERLPARTLKAKVSIPPEKLEALDAGALTLHQLCLLDEGWNTKCISGELIKPTNLIAPACMLLTSHARTVSLFEFNHC